MYDNYFNLNSIDQELKRVWPGWTAVKLLGKGSLGAVYEIHKSDRDNPEKAALKVIHVPENDDEAEKFQYLGMYHQSTDSYYKVMVDEIQNVIKTMQRFVGNSYIVSYEDYAIRKRYYQVGYAVYIRMELLDGMTDYMKRSAFSEQRVIKLGMDISQGLRDYHNSGIIHRDVNPENIFVNRGGDFKLGVFGVSQADSDSHIDLPFKGMLDYMAPEVYKMQAIDARSDIYSLGMILYQCLNGNRLPFLPDQSTSEDIEKARARRIAGENLPYPAYGSHVLQKIVLKAVAARPEDRFQTVDEMYQALLHVYRAGRSVSVARYQNTDRQAINQGTDLGTNQGTDLGTYRRVYKRTNQETSDERKHFPLGTVLMAVVWILILMYPVGSSLEDEIEMIKYGPEPRIQTNIDDYAIDWKDAALEAKMREITGITSGDIMYSDVQHISELYLSNAPDSTDDVKIKDISALENLTGLISLNLSWNQISDISALRYMTGMRELYLNYNQISDISALSGMRRLYTLQIGGNQISDISALSELTDLTNLLLFNNQISDISALKKMKKLWSLNLCDNPITDYSPIERLDIDRLYK